MKVRISDLSAAGLKISEDIPLDALNARMAEGAGNDIIFTAAPHVEIHVTPSAHGADTKGTVKTKYRQPCSMCAKELDRELEIAANFTLKRRPEESDPDAPEYADDIGISYFSGDHVELEELIQEALILSLSRYWRPPQNKDGSCQVCGKKAEAPKDIEGVNNLGRLLKGAGVK